MADLTQTPETIGPLDLSSIPLGCGDQLAVAGRFIWEFHRSLSI